MCPWRSPHQGLRCPWLLVCGSAQYANCVREPIGRDLRWCNWTWRTFTSKKNKTLSPPCRKPWTKSSGSTVEQVIDVSMPQAVDKIVEHMFSTAKGRRLWTKSPSAPWTTGSTCAGRRSWKKSSMTPCSRLSTCPCRRPWKKSSSALWSFFFSTCLGRKPWKKSSMTPWSRLSTCPGRRQWTKIAVCASSWMDVEHAPHAHAWQNLGLV